jgi:hypothetical protein
MQTQTACEALRTGKRLAIQYDGFSRIVEVHAVGFTKEGNAVMRVWQVSGGSARSEPTGWKLLTVGEARAFAITGDASAAPRIGYKRGDPAMSRIICQV